MKYVGNVRIGEYGIVKTAINAHMAYLSRVSIAVMMTVLKNFRSGSLSRELEAKRL